MTRSRSGLLARLLACAAWTTLLAGAPGPAAALDEAGRLWLVGERAFEDKLHAVSRASLERLIQRIQTYPDVWFATCAEVAEWSRANRLAPSQEP